MRVQIITPAPRGSRLGNRVTALRWATHLRALGHGVRVREVLDGDDCDVVIALHARKSAAAVESSKRIAPGRPVVLVLTGTDVYGDLQRDADAQRSLDLADRIVVLQPAALAELPAEARAKAEVVLQSASPPATSPLPDPRHFDVLVVAHLREVKDPLLAARAARLLPSRSRIRVRLVGQALEPELAGAAEREAAENPRFEWLGPLAFGRTQELLASSRLLVVSSRNEGGPAVITEAIASAVPVLSTRMPAALILLGDAYPGLYECGDVAALAGLLGRCETAPEFLESLRRGVVAHQPDVLPETERERLRTLLAELPAG